MFHVNSVWQLIEIRFDGDIDIPCPYIRIICQISGTRYKHVPAIFSRTLTPAIRIVSSSILASYSHVSLVIDSIQRVMLCTEAFVIIQGITIHAITIRAMLILQQMFVIATHTVINKTKFALTDCGKITDCILTF